MKVRVAATRMACSKDCERNMAKADTLIRGAAAAGVQVILPQEMFSMHEFRFMEMGPAPPRPRSA